MNKVTIGAALGQAFGFISEAWARAWGIMLATVVSTAVFQGYDAVHKGPGLVPFLGFVISVFVGTAVAGALYRLRLSADHPGDDAFAAHPAGAQWGALEWRVLGANLLVGLIIGLMAFITFIVWALILGVSIGENPALMQAVRDGGDAEKMQALKTIMLGPAGVLTLVVVLPISLGIVYIAIRLSLFAVMAADTRRFDLRRAWELARGAMATLIVATVLLVAADFLIGVVVGAAAGLVSGLTGHVGQGGKWGGVAGQVVGAAINAPLFAGLALYVYRTQRGDDGVASTFV
ncbi:MAG TPA: hypothetical protein VFE13_11645 [Caulobacteraceae bacterium]|nr:hypothetical protein [Caulobacteraceae bacterium]